MTLHARIDAILNNVNAEQVFHDIHNGHDVPLLTDYFLRRMPPEANSGPPPELVGGRDLTPLFANTDFYSVYCYDSETGAIFVIDMEQPWPPAARFEAWQDFNEHLYQLIGAERSDGERQTLRKLLALD